MSKPLAPNSAVTVGNVVFDNYAALALIAGPCQFESRQHAFDMAGAPSELRFAAIVYSVRNVGVVAKLLAAGAIAHDIRGNQIVVPPAPGQGAGFIFREIK